MKCKFVLDVDVDPAAMSVTEHGKIQFRKSVIRDVRGGISRPGAVAYLPAGTEYEHPDAYLHVVHGLAMPADDECAVMAGMTDEEIKNAQYWYARQNAVKEEDFPLYDAGVILGYDPESDDGYKHGPQWEKYQAALLEHEQEKAANLS
jgi:hypothetical protein